MAAITMESVCKSFAKTDVIRNVNLSIEDGEFTVFVGPSGCGKSTLLRLIAGLEEVDSGELLFDQQSVTELEPAKRGIAMVFQSYALYPHMSVFKNMAFGLKLAKTDKQTIADRVGEAARILQIEHLLERKPKELSGGQRQRVAIGRAIVRKPKVFLFDEPLSNLDAALRIQTRLELKRLHQQLGTTMIYVTHDQVEAMTLADRIVVLNNGCVEQIGAPLEIYRRPRNLFVAGFIGSPKMNFIETSVTKNGEHSLVLKCNEEIIVPAPASHASALEKLAGQTLTLGIRPEHLQLSTTSSTLLKGEVITIEHLGAESFVFLDYGAADPLVVKCAADYQVQPGQLLGVEFPAQHCYLFSQDGVAIY